MDTPEIHVNISSQTCRVCLETHETNLYVHDEIKYNDLKLELWQLLEAVSKLKVKSYNFKKLRKISSIISSGHGRTQICLCICVKIAPAG